MYSKMLYMKTRVTFRVPPDLARALRELPNQTQFVEAALRDALGTTCPTCCGTGRLAAAPLLVSDFRQNNLPRLSRSAALQLKQLVSLAHTLSATDLALERAEARSDDLRFSLARGEQVLLAGALDSRGTQVSLDEN